MKKLSCILGVAVVLLLGACTRTANNIPLPEHPRPDFERPQWHNLNGAWHFTFSESLARRAMQEGADLALMGHQIMVPFPWGTKMSGIEDEKADFHHSFYPRHEEYADGHIDSTDIGWYAREIQIPKSWQGKRVFLVVGAADWATTVWLDGKELGQHQGGYTPFEFELGNITPGESHRLFIRVDDTWSLERLYGKQEYGDVRGIWQTVYLEARSQNFIRSLHFTPDVDSSQVKVTVVLDQPAQPGESFRLCFRTGGQKDFVGQFNGLPRATFTVPLKDQHLWDLDDPFLYEVTAMLSTGDEVRSYFGQRKIGTTTLPGTDYSYVALNNKPVYLQFCLDQSYYPGSHYTFPSDEVMKNEILQSKKLGLNGNRIHIKVEVPRKLYWADRLGLLIMADTPHFWGQATQKARRDWEHCLRVQVERDYNHPSIFSWINFNETWGLFDSTRVYTPENQEWVRRMYRLTKALDHSRLVEDQSACNNDHVETDLNSWHVYRPGYDWEHSIKLYCDSTYEGSTYNFIGGRRQGRQPMFNSECGNVWGYGGSAGDCDFSWDYHIMTDVFRRYPECSGWLYTEHHDVVKEWNGYVRFDRSQKFDGLSELVPGMSLADLHSPYYISPQRYLYSEPRGGEHVSIPLYASFMTDRNPGNLVLETELVGWDQLGQAIPATQKQSRTLVFQPWLNGLVDSLQVDIPVQKGLYLLRMVLKGGGKILQRNFTTFRVREGQDLQLEKTRLVTFAPKNFTAQEWSLKHSLVLDGLKVNGFGTGYFEYTIQLPQDVDPTRIKQARLVFEASSREYFTRDKSDQPSYEYDRLSSDPCIGGNAYSMTDERLWPSQVEVSINQTPVGKTELEDCPADHRGILSWGSQPQDWHLHEAGSYGKLIDMIVPTKLLQGDRQVTIRFTVPSSSTSPQGEKGTENVGGGLALYGQDFGRYPMDPTLVLTLK